MKKLWFVLLILCLGLAAGCKEEKEAAKEAAGTVKEKAVEAAGAVKEAAKGAAETVKEKAAEVKEAIPVEIAPAGGEKVYKAKCAVCHGAGGTGTGTAPAFVGNEWTKNSSKAEIADVIKNGRLPKDKRHKNFAMGMPAQKGMPDDDIAAVVDYLKSLD